MMDIEIRVLDQRLHEWGLPTYQTEGAAAIDLHACVDEPLLLEAGAKATLIPLGFAMHIRDPGIAALIFPRSGLGHKKGLVLGNTVGVIDPDYMGPLMASGWNRHATGEAIVVEPGERIAQLVFVPIVRPTLVPMEAFSSASDRGEGGFGSTGARHPA